MKKFLVDLKPMGREGPTQGREAERDGHSPWQRCAVAGAFSHGTEMTTSVLGHPGLWLGRDLCGVAHLTVW